VREGENRFGIGSKATAHYNNTLSHREEIPIRGFESTVDRRLNFGLGKINKIDSVVGQIIARSFYNFFYQH
jgi:enediyne biosynthesis protein E4